MFEREFEAIPCYQILKILSNQAYFGCKRTTIQYWIEEKANQKLNLPTNVRTVLLFRMKPLQGYFNDANGIRKASLIIRDIPQA
jgi:hypothetical protein